MTEQPKTVADIEWHVSPYFKGWVYAEDQALFDARQYAEQVTSEHNSYQALKQRLHEQQHRIEVDYDGQGTDADAYQGPVPDVL